MSVCCRARVFVSYSRVCFIIWCQKHPSSLTKPLVHAINCLPEDGHRLLLAHNGTINIIYVWGVGHRENRRKPTI